ncbi:MAG: enoyl-CoA hydratase-related protein [Candidatus Kapabacteria bacterium]|nr:enoyl-CoA hydratase-related protein [Candidatus Kapabacteria bacterium]MCS7169323.1 enoyl-CoA hydratase-related protein [Candidatus Kapabacteria bacterium]MDW7996062.1 enoyl-CoA hydratase-related protein [Bacteroidota bacterium]MDW8224920.1 enoyl-CoA hydratase-related protein [Bacteroidota bacterium]
MELSTVLYTVERGVATIALNRPDAHNAVNAQMGQELLVALRAAEHDANVRCVVLTGVGRAFCSGQDLKEVPSGETTFFREVLRQRYNPIIRSLRNIPKPVIGAINGVAAGAGLSLALATDFRIMSSSARLVEAFIGIALVPDSGSSFFYVRSLGYARAFEFATLNKPISAEQALQWGLVNVVISPEAFPQTVGRFAQVYAQGPTQTYGYLKELLNRAFSLPLDDMLELEAEYQQRAGETPDYTEGVRAFLEKRPPRFTGSLQTGTAR